MQKRVESERLTRLGRWRRQEGLTLAEVAALTGLSIGMLSYVERGERQLAPLTRIQLARRLGVSVQELFEVDPLVDDAMPA